VITAIKPVNDRTPDAPQLIADANASAF